MKNPMRKAVLVAGLAALVWPGYGAYAVCTNLADTTSLECIEDLKCQTEIFARSQAFVTAVQAATHKAIKTSLAGKFNKLPAKQCTATGATCYYNNGKCKTAGLIGAPCSVNADCTGAGICDRKAGCNFAIADDTNECAVKQSKVTPASDTLKAKSNMVKFFISKCTRADLSLIDPVDLGLDQNANCPEAKNQPPRKAYEALAKCVFNSADGDRSGGKVIDSTLAPFFKLGARGVIPPKSKTGGDPKALLQYAGTQVLQIGSGVGGNTDNNLTPGASITVQSLAHCVGGNGNLWCVVASDCGVGGTCTGNSTTGLTDSFGHLYSGVQTTGADLVHNDGIGNSLSVSATCSNSVAACLMTSTVDAGNGTPEKGQVNLTTGELYSNTPIQTIVYVTSLGANCAEANPCPLCINPSNGVGTCSGMCTNGGLITATPRACSSDADCESGDTCAGLGGTCVGANLQPSQECSPTALGVGSSGTVPNPLEVSTTVKTMNAVANKFCGFCDTSGASGCQATAAQCAQGCALDAALTPNGNAVCIAKFGAGFICDTSGTVNGFHGDATVTSIAANGTPNLIAPQEAGVFCTGITGNPLVNNASGLPGPVRLIAPYINLWVN